MPVAKIKLSPHLTDAQRSIIRKKLGNPNEFSPIPVKLADNQIWIGFGPEVEDAGVWDELYRMLGCRAHCV